MSTQTTTPANTATTAAVREVFLAVWSVPQAHVTDLADRTGHNTRFVREALGLLESFSLVHEDSDGEYLPADGAWQSEDDLHVAFDAAFGADGAVVTDEDTVPDDKPAKAKPAPADLPGCKCGCGGNVKKASSRYIPGHDARHAGLVGRRAAGLEHEEQREHLIRTSLDTESLRLKAEGVLVNALKKQTLQSKAADRKVEREAERAVKKAAKAAKSEPKAPTYEEGTAKVGRWEYPTRTSGEAGDRLTERNTKRDGSGEWVPFAAS